MTAVFTVDSDQSAIFGDLQSSDIKAYWIWTGGFINKIYARTTIIAISNARDVFLMGSLYV